MFNQRFRLDCPESTHRCTHAGHDSQLREVLGHVDQVRLGRALVALCPFDRAFQGFVQQLPGHHRQHDFAQDRDEHGDHVQPQQADFQQMGEFCFTRLDIDFGGGHRMAAGIGIHLVAVLLKQVVPQVHIVRPRPAPLAGDIRGRDIRIGCRFHFCRTRRWQLLDMGGGRQLTDRLDDGAPRRRQRAARGIGSRLGELAVVIPALRIRHELAEKALVGRGAGIVGLHAVSGGEQALEFLAHLRGGIALERMLRVLGNVENHFVVVAVLLADHEGHAAGHALFHQAHVVEPDLLVTHPRVHFAIDHRDDHPVVRRLDVPGQ